MRKDRMMPCKYYIDFGECSRGRNANMFGYCQKCEKYDNGFKSKNKNSKRRKYFDDISRMNDEEDW